MGFLFNELIIQTQNQESEEQIPFENAKELRRKIELLEFSLKQNLGIYIVEFRDGERELILKKYSDASKLRMGAPADLIIDGSKKEKGLTERQTL